ncbi:MAG: hypothetical protein J6T98_11740 [Salinivirgaceae bacterium]|nr:hypothetical protein [Salinivirgaceae bacterium]
MKRTLLSLLLVGGLIFSVSAQKKSSPLAGLGSMTFYGIDFSKGRVYGAADEPEKLRKAFADINMLFIMEPEKYNVAQFVGKPMNDIRVDAVTNMNDTIPLDSIKTIVKGHVLTDTAIRKTVKDLNIVPYNHGMGLVMIMETLDKPGELGTFEFVLFDIDTRNVISHWSLSGEPGGFGLRNYWGRSVYDALGKVKTYKE